MARASVEDFLSNDNRIDIGLARRRGKLHLLKRHRERVVRTTTRDDGQVREETVEREVSLHDAQAALKDMMQYHGLLSDILEIRRLPKGPAELRQFIKERLPAVRDDGTEEGPFDYQTSAAGSTHTFRLLEGIAADGKSWIERHGPDSLAPFQIAG